MTQADQSRGLRQLTVDQVLRLYGPTLALLITLALLVVLLPTEKNSESGLGLTSGSGSGDASGSSVSEGLVEGGDSSGDLGAGGDAGAGSPAGGTAGTVGTAVTPGGSAAATLGTGPKTADGKAAIVSSGPDCRADGRQIGVSVWQPPCVKWQAGSDNGGATSRGVTKDKILVNFNLSELNTAGFAVGTAAGIQQSNEQIKTYSNLWLKYYNNHTQTYGREVVFNYVESSGSDDAALRADVRRAATENKAFAFIGACCARPQLQEGGAQKLAMVTSPGQPLADDLAQNPFAITRAPTVEWVFEDAGQYMCNRLQGRKAKWAGDPVIKGQQRKFGLMFSAGAGAGGPAQSPAVPVLERAFAECGGKFAAKVGISGDTSSWSNETSNAIAKMKDAGVTTIVYFAPILSQVFATQNADSQAYLPEWYVGGTCCNDAVIVNRAASKTQTSQFFGTSNQFAWFRDDGSTFEAVREAVIGNNRQPLPNVGSSGSATNNASLTGTIWWPLIQAFFNCLQGAGPTLTPETWRKGCEQYGTTGGQIKDFGFPKRFFQPKRPFLVQDQAEWWWDPNETCNDEANRAGTGCTSWYKNGLRTGFKAWPQTEPDLFNRATSKPTQNMPTVWEDPKRSVTKKCMSCS